MTNEFDNESPLFTEDDSRPLGADAIPPEPDDYAYDEGESAPVYRGASGDPTFGFLLAAAVSVGLIPMLPENIDLRYTLAWGALAAVGVLAWLLGSAERIGQEEPEDLAWGVGFGLLVSIPFLLFGSGILSDVAALIFPMMSPGTVLAYLVFVMPLAETLFFRSVMQNNLPFWIVGLLSGIWSILLFFPVMWGTLIDAWFVGLVIAVTLLTINMIYSYVHERNGLAAAWLCQIVMGLLLIFIPSL